MVANREKRNAACRKWRAMHREENKSIKKKWVAKNREAYLVMKRRADCKSKFGITLQQREGIFERFGHRCAICGTQPVRKHLHLDHCHETKQIRGPLCQRCNMGIGLFREDVTLMKAAIAYLEVFAKEDIRKDLKT